MWPWSKKLQPAAGPRHPIHPGWLEYTRTLLVSGHQLRLRPIRRSDGPRWSELRIDDHRILEPVEPTVSMSWKQAHDHSQWRSIYIALSQAAHSGTVVPLAIEIDGAFYGQLTLGNIQHGSVSDCWIGYWVHSSMCGKGMATAACALGVDHGFGRVGVHRITATHLPENQASHRVLQKCGFRNEGLLRRNLHINGRWQDHYLMAMTAEEYPDTATQRLIAVGGAQPLKRMGGHRRA